MQKAYHEISPDKLEASLGDGLKCTSRGVKSDDPAIIKTDRFLDAHCPRALKEQGVSRANNLYAYVCADGLVVDITDGSRVPLDTFVTTNSQQVLEITIDPTRCFISDLDAYDALKLAIERGENQADLATLATDYWSKLTPLSKFTPPVIRRPEIMVTYDIPPSDLRAL